jgi:hypothetical protein
VGAIDDVRLHAGVRTAAQLGEEALHPPGRPTTPYSGSLGRYLSHGGDHLTTTGPVPPGYRFERPLGLPAPNDAPDTRMLYACRSGDDLFTSADRGCEGRPHVADIGRVYIHPPDGVSTKPLYRCTVTSSGEHFESHLADCEGQTVEFLLGHVRAYAPLVSHAQEDPPRDRRTSIGSVPGTYRAEHALGFVELVGGSGRRLLYGCTDGGDAFSSLDPACEGKEVLGGNGYVWTAPPAGVESAQLYRCRTRTNGWHYDSLTATCEGDIVDGPLGYVVTAR